VNYFVTWASIIGGVGFFFDYLDRTVNKDTQQGLVKWIQSYTTVTFTKRLQSLNNLFLRIFKCIPSQRLGTRVSDYSHITEAFGNHLSNT